MHSADFKRCLRATDKYRDLYACAAKKAYESEKGAKLAVTLNPKQAGRYYYKCERCGSWHTTRQRRDR